MIARNEKETMKMKQKGILAGVALAACLLFGVLPATASAAPELSVTSWHSGNPSSAVMSPDGHGAYRIWLRNTGDVPTSGPITITDTLPAGLTAVSAVDKRGAWNCSIAPSGASVTCTGPNLGPIPVGKDPCESSFEDFDPLTGVFGPDPCPVEIKFTIAASAPDGVGHNQVEACGGGAAQCSTSSDATRVLSHLPYGDRYGLAPINDHPLALEDVPAFESAPGVPAEHAFWAGACDRSAAVGFFGPMGPLGGFGTRPSQIVVASEFTTPPAFFANSSPSPAHCIDSGGITPYFSPGGAQRIWRTLPDPYLKGPAGSLAPSWRLPATAQAGAHPDGTTSFAWNRGDDHKVDGGIDNIYVDLPPGIVGNPEAVPTCTEEQFAVRPLACPPETQVGLLNLSIEGVPFGGANTGLAYETNYPVFNLEPRPGNVAELGFGYASGERAVTVRLVAKTRTNGDFGITAFTGQIPAALPPIAQTITIWGVPWAAENDDWRLKENSAFVDPCDWTEGTVEANDYIPRTGLIPSCQATYQPSWGSIEPFFTNETDCSPAPTVTLRTDVFQHPGDFTSEGDPVPTDPDWKTYETIAPPVTGCGDLDFEPQIALDPKSQGGSQSQATDSPTGLDVELTIPQNNDLPFDPPASGATQPEIDQYIADASAYFHSLQGLATPHLRDTTVTLPEGMTLNPAAADGQAACSMAEIGVTDVDSPEPPRIRFDNQPVACPEASKVGEVVVETPLLAESDWPKGSVYLAQQGDNPFGSDFAIYMALEAKQRGLIVKLAGEVEPNPATGQLTTTFTENPELPFDKFRLRFKAGPRAPLATPTTCGTHVNVNSFTSHAQPNSPVAVNDPFQITSSPAGGCPTSKEQRPFNPGFSAGSTEIVAGSHTPFTARFTRGDGNQELDRIELTTPEGFAAKLAGVPYCSEASIAQATGRTATGDGVKEQANSSCPDASKVGTTTIGAGAGSSPFFVKGNVYLAGPYKGAPVSLAFIVPAVAGPFDLGVQVVRTALSINPKTAQVTAVSDTIPKILKGVPLRLRDVRVDINRKDFTLNPTDCAQMAVSGKVYGASGAVTDVSSRFQVAECARLGFKPKLTLQLKGGTRRTKYQGLTAIVTPRPGDANIARTSVTMPRSAFLAQEHIRTVCTRVQFAADACPAGAIYGKATAWSPLLDEPLSGNVYLRSSDNKLPDLVADLRGPASQPIRVELSGRTDSFKRALRNTFDIVPDAAVTRFRLDLFGGDKGLIVNSQDLCKKVHKATVKMTAQNGKEHNFRPVVKNGCTKKQGGEKAKQGKKGSAKQRSVTIRSLATVAGGLF